MMLDETRPRPELASLPQSVLAEIVGCLSKKEASKVARVCKSLRAAGENTVWASIKLAQNRERVLSQDLLDLSELLRRRAPRAAAIRRLDIRRQDRCNGRAPDGDEAVEDPNPGTAPFSKYDRETAWGIVAALALPELPACQIFLVTNGSCELLWNLTRATPNLLELQPERPFPSLRLTSLEVNTFDCDALHLALRLITASERTLRSLTLWLRTKPGQRKLARFVQLGSTVAYPSLHNLRELHVPVMFCPPSSVGSGVTVMSISHQENEYLGRGRSRWFDIPPRPALERLTISKPLFNGHPNPCTHTVLLDDDLLQRIKQTSNLRSVNEFDWRFSAEISELVGDADEPVYHIRFREKTFIESDPVTDFTSYKGDVVPIDILRMMYRRSGLDIAARNDQRRMTVDGEAFCFMKAYMQIMSKKDLGEPCKACQAEA